MPKRHSVLVERDGAHHYKVFIRVLRLRLRLRTRTARQLRDCLNRTLNARGRPLAAS